MPLTPQAGPPPTALTIAGFDPSSGAGITADLQVFAAHGLFGISCITALTVQSTRGVRSMTPVSHLMEPTLQELAADLPPAGVKIGMLGREEAVLSAAAFLRRERSQRVLPVVLDPVIRSSSGAALLESAGLRALQDELLPAVDWLTPNRAELAALTGMTTDSVGEVGVALRFLQAQHPHLHVVVTGGDAGSEDVVDVLLAPDGDLQTFSGPRVSTRSTHGTGCAFSSALLARLVLGYAPADAVAAAKAYVTEALRRAPGLGAGHGPMHLLWPLATAAGTLANPQ